MNDTPTTEVDPLDRIEKSIDIAATAEKVFALVSRPGWWINDGTAVDPEPDIRSEDGFTVLTHPEYGEFRFETVASEPPSFVALRCHHDVPDDGKKRSTLVEFQIEPRAGGGVRLDVIESGFSGLQKPRADWLQDRENNVRGWDAELEAARRFVESG